MPSPSDQLVADLVYARVLFTLQIQELQQQDLEMKKRLLSVMNSYSPNERECLCEEALEGAWDRARKLLA